MGMFGPGKEGWLAEAEMLSWAFRHLKAEERDYLTKRLKHVLGKRTLKGSWFEKDKSLLEMLDVTVGSVKYISRCLWRGRPIVQGWAPCR